MRTRTTHGFARWTGTRRDWLIAFMLLMATIQCVRADFLTNESFVDWQSYAAGTAPMPYQGRVGMIPVLRAAEGSPAFRRVAARFGQTITVGSLHQEPVTVEKVASMLAGIVALTLMMTVAFWWSRRRQLRPWWLANVLLLAIATVTLTLRATQNFWYAYDLPHAALFGCAVLFALESRWLPAMVCYALDVPMRETSLFLILVFAGFFYLERKRLTRKGQVEHRVWTPVGVTAISLLGAWTVLRHRIGQQFRDNPTEAVPHYSENLHHLLFPHHWPQLFSAGGYLVVFLWLERRRLTTRDRWVLYAALLSMPLTLVYGVWTETRVWLEWTLPLAALGAAEVDTFLNGCIPHSERSGSKSIRLQTTLASGD